MAAAWALTLLAAGMPAQGSEAKQPPVLWQQFLADHEAATAKYATALQATVASPAYKAAQAKNDDEAMRALREKVKVDDAAFGKRALELGEQLAGDDRVTCLIWAAVHGNDAAISNRVIDAIIKDHVKSARLVNLFENFTALGRQVMPTKAQRLLEDVISDNPHAEVRAWAMYVGARNVARNREATAEQKQQAADWLQQAEVLAAGTDLAGRIAAPKFEKEHLQIGMAAPEIAGADIDGVPFKLSDYRGKVVVLDFWGFW
jgi:hypothetical protein